MQILMEFRGRTRSERDRERKSKSRERGYVIASSISRDDGERNNPTVTVNVRHNTAYVWRLSSLSHIRAV